MFIFFPMQYTLSTVMRSSGKLNDSVGRQDFVICVRSVVNKFTYPGSNSNELVDLRF